MMRYADVNRPGPTLSRGLILSGGLAQGAIGVLMCFTLIGNLPVQDGTATGPLVAHYGMLAVVVWWWFLALGAVSGWASAGLALGYVLGVAPRSVAVPCVALVLQGCFFAIVAFVDVFQAPPTWLGIVCAGGLAGATVVLGVSLSRAHASRRTRLGLAN